MKTQHMLQLLHQGALQTGRVLCHSPETVTDAAFWAAGAHAAGPPVCPFRLISTWVPFMIFFWCLYVAFNIRSFFSFEK